MNVRTRHGSALLILAAKIGETDFMKVLIAAGADVNIQDGKGDTAIMKASEFGHCENHYVVA